ncbi:hypothetical protein LQ938_09650 [Microbacterium sp. cx-55]|uniref:hypothetical protein n=1 Tax=Microbacterium sp. cx-55 TaxID=2875948 RepID=UPI001CBF74CA|nr:hypothetical protein [Microbacterium sp. cx-55]MBZ4485975.1 hypothetical protein [Microbacterium sp. cx-55]UGB34151.1 hypothetical protein LQ938_09650 [Microbacterium sp. cx-55]
MTIVNVYPRPGSGVAVMKNAEILEEDEVGITLHYSLDGRNTGPITSMIPWHNIGRVEYPEGIEAAA